MSNWVVMASKSVLKQQITDLDDLVRKGIDTTLYQFACLEQFMNCIGFKVVCNNKVWHIVDTRKNCLRKYMGFEDALSLYNVPKNVNVLMEVYNIQKEVFFDFHNNVKQVHKLKLKRCKGGIITTNNFVRFKDKG